MINRTPTVTSFDRTIERRYTRRIVVACDGLRTADDLTFKQIENEKRRIRLVFRYYQSHYRRILRYPGFASTLIKFYLLFLRAGDCYFRPSGSFRSAESLSHNYRPR